MERPIRLAHYVNQFFAGIGGEERADQPFEVRVGAVGPGLALAAALGAEAEIVVTLLCGDNRANEESDDVVARALGALREAHVDALVAGPAFDAGRYGLACGRICAAAREELGLPSLMGAHPESPAVDSYRARTLIVATERSAAGMRAAIPTMARLALKLARGEPLGPAADEGYVARGYRANTWATVPAATRAVDLLLARVAGRPWESELVVPTYDRVPPAAPLAASAQATIGLATEGGLVPPGNPDRLEAVRATRWARYALGGQDTLLGSGYQSVHGGYDARWVHEDPNRMVPLDAARALEQAGALGHLHEAYYATVGCGTAIDQASAIGRAMAEDLKARGVDGVILTAT